MKQTPKATKVFISYQLTGDEAEEFLAYKQGQFLKNNAEAARKLMLERLHQTKAESNEPEGTQRTARALQAAKRAQASAARG